jgi:hypothetical protein
VIGRAWPLQPSCYDGRVSVEERRRHPRIVVDIPVVVRANGAEHPARLRDICREAALVEADMGWPLEAELGLRMELPGTGGSVEIGGRVIRLAPGEAGRQGMAILFTDVTAAAGMRIDFFVSLQSDLSGPA